MIWRSPRRQHRWRRGLALYVDGIYESALFAANPLADFPHPDTSDGIGPQLTGRRLYADAADALLARENAVGEILFALTGHLGSVRGWVDSDGPLIQSLAYKSFGLLVRGWTSESRFGFTGREWSEKAALFALRARSYDPTVGQFVSEDSV